MRKNKTEATREPRRKVLGVSLAAFEETKKLYDAWLGYLLGLLGTDTLRVKVDDISKALEGFSCAATREGDEYAISITRRPCEAPTAHVEASKDVGESGEDGHE